ncbi:D-alanyl-D-alanine carboxypeptidase family protein [Candidatus Parcubacteria bacterium]|nr:D-alanyl-D-alanine carboxypeptidase family protein [Candidatus Parcubacteria bacterium]
MLNYIKLQWVRCKTLQAYRSGDWKEITIKENGEPLVKIPKEISFPYYSRVMKLTDNKEIYLRQKVFNKIKKARLFLQREGFDLKVYDGWRGAELQENLFWYYMRAFTAKQFGKKEELEQFNTLSEIKIRFEIFSPEIQAAMIGANRTYVSLPSKNPLCPSPHTTGGAVDVWLFKDNKAANLGVPFDWMKKNAGAFYHLKFKRKRFLGNDSQICHNREILLLAMIKAGFSCYGPEIWHFNYGNQMDALVKGGHAIYSYIEP